MWDMAQSAGWEWVESDNLEAYVVRPDNGNLHAIVLLQEILGVNATMRECAATMGEEGYAVAVPDLYWRLHRRVDLGYDKDQVESGFSFSKRLDDRLACDDIAATVRHVRATMPLVRFVHLMGFCLGGRLAVLAAPDRNVTSAISLYGVGIERHLDALAKVACPLQLHFAGKDRWVPPSAVAAVEQAAAGRDVEIHHYPGIGHGFFPRTRPGHDRAASEAAWGRIRAFMDRVSSH
jgi:carboxymethylenebutenolidase